MNNAERDALLITFVLPFIVTPIGLFNSSAREVKVKRTAELTGVWMRNSLNILWEGWLNGWTRDNPIIVHRGVDCQSNMQVVQWNHNKTHSDALLVLVHRSSSSSSLPPCDGMSFDAITGSDPSSAPLPIYSCLINSEQWDCKNPNPYRNQLSGSLDVLSFTLLPWRGATATDAHGSCNYYNATLWVIPFGCVSEIREVICGK